MLEELIATAAADYVGELIHDYAIRGFSASVDLIYRPTGELVASYPIEAEAIPMTTILLSLTEHQMRIMEAS